MTKPPKVKVSKKADAEAPSTAEPIAPASNDLRQVLAHNLRMARLAIRMTQRELAKASGLSQRHISVIEMARVNTGIDALAALASALPGITPSELLTPSTRQPR